MGYVGGLYTGIKYVAGLVDTPEQVTKLDDFLKAAIDARKVDSIVSIFMMPFAFYTSGDTPVIEGIAVQMPDTVSGYKPKNNKLFTYPYNFVCVDTLNSANNYRYEWSYDKNAIHFSLVCAMSDNPEIVIAPRDYNGTERTQTATELNNLTESVTCSGFPQCAFSIDTYRAWLAQKSTGDILSLIGNTASTAINLGSAIGSAGAASAAGAAAVPGANVAVGVLGVLGIANQINNMMLSATQGSKARGHIGSSTEVGIRNKGVFFKVMQVSKEFAMMIDDFFERFGYTCGRIKVPNRNVRPHWTYTKTKECSIRGSIPVDAMAKIKSIYNNGVTFWKNGSEVGNYGLDNRVV